jgi:hypothetical protein
MRVSTAISQIKKEAEFLGLSFEDTLKEIEKLGGMVFSERSMMAYMSYINQASEFQLLNGVRK